jgi:hypothetical protein
VHCERTDSGFPWVFTISFKLSLSRLGITAPLAAVANLPQSCAMTVTATFLDGTAQQQTCFFSPQPELGGIYTPQLEDLNGPTQHLATCILPSTWQNVINVGLSSAPTIDLPTGSTLSSSMLVDSIIFSGNTWTWFQACSQGWWKDTGIFKKIAFRGQWNRGITDLLTSLWRGVE